MKNILLSVLTFVLLTGCNAAKQTNTSQISETYGLNMKIEHYYHGDYYVHIAKDGGKWHVVEVMKTKPKDFDSKDELISFNKAMTVTGPAYTTKLAENIVGCTAFDGASSTYSICNSEFTDTNVANTALIGVFTLGISVASGGGYAVTFDEEEYADIVKESGAIERVRGIINAENEKERALAAAEAEKQRVAKAAEQARRDKIDALTTEAYAFISDRVDVTPNVIDKSGLYAKENLVSISKHFETINENSNIKQIRYAYVIEPNQTDYHFDLSKSTENFAYTDTKLEFKPTVTITSKDIPNLALNYQAANTDLAIAVRGVGGYGTGDLFMQLENKSNSFITVDSISFYAGKDIQTRSALNIKLPPYSQGTYSFQSTPTIGHYFRQFTLKQTKRSLSKARPQIGIAASYIKDGANKSLFNQEKIKIADTHETFPRNNKVEVASAPFPKTETTQQEKSNSSSKKRHYAGNIYVEELISGMTYTVSCGTMPIGGVVSDGQAYYPTELFGKRIRIPFHSAGEAIEFVGKAAGCF